MTILILGGGYLGQLLHTLLPSARVLDWRTNAPTTSARSFGPQYLWTPVGELPTRSFHVITAVDDMPATPESVLAYKHKVGKAQDASDWQVQFRHITTGYEAELPPPRVEYGQRVTAVDRSGRRLLTVKGEWLDYDWLISTIPLPALCELCKTFVPSLQSRPIYVWTRPTEPRSYLYVNYISAPSTPVYRVTTRDGLTHSESLDPVETADVKVHRLLPGKIYAHDLVPEVLDRMELSNILPVGRYGAWDPEQLAHQTYAQVAVWKARTL